MSAKPQRLEPLEPSMDTAEVCEALKRALVGRDAELAGSTGTDTPVLRRNLVPGDA